MTDQQHPITPPPELMTDTTRNLIIKLSSHMAYMQGQLEARHELDDLEDYYWYRESVALRQQVADALAADDPAVPEGREPASVTGEPSDEELLKVAGQAAHIDDILDALEEGYPAPVPVTEKLPGDELCWWFEADEDCGYGSSWTLLRIRGSATGYTHWLPATALPIPGQGEI